MTKQARLILKSINGTITDHRFIVFAFFSAVIIRLLLAYFPGFKFDIDAWYAWAIRLNSLSLANFYSPDVWTNYTPGYLYILAWLAQIKNLLSLSSDSFYILLKIPAIITDLIIAGIIYCYARPRFSPRASLAFTSLILFNPFVIFNSAIWGQIDSILALFIILAILTLNRSQLILSSICFAVALLIKPQALSIALIYPLYLARHFSFKNTFQLTVPGFIVLILGSIPFFISNPIQGIISLIKQMTSDYPYNSLFAYNLWGTLGYWIQDNTTLFGLTYRNWGLGLLAFFYMGISHIYLRKRLDLISLATLATLGFYFLPTRIHERYLYPALILLIFTIITHFNRRLIITFLTLSLFHTLNLYYVYVYYNEIFPDAAKILHQPILFDLLQSSNQSLSLISFLVFSITTYLIISANTKPPIASTSSER